MIGVSPAAATKAVTELINAGHLRVERRGRNHGCTATRERVVSLTRHDTETAKGDPDLPIKLWQKRCANAPELSGSTPENMGVEDDVSTARSDGITG